MPPRSTKRPRADEGSSRGEGQEAAQCVRNRDFATRRAILLRRAVIHERGIQVATLEGTTIPAIIRDRGWGNLAGTRGEANITLVREFFASMIPENYRNGGRVLVRGVVVEISESRINGHFGTAPVRQSALPLGYTAFDGGSEVLARLLRRNDDGVWTKKHPVRQSDLTKDMALMNLFNSASLRPVSHTSSLAFKRGELLACYLAGSPIDVGRLIKTEINDAGEIDLKNKPQAMKKPVPFPQLITILCREAGVPEYDSDEVIGGDKGDLSIRSWKDLTSKTKGRRKLARLPSSSSSRPAADSGPEESDEEDEDDDDFLPPEEELDLDASEQTGSISESQFDRIMAALTASKDATARVEGKIDTLSNQFTEYMQLQDFYRQEQEAESEDIRIDVAAIRTQLGFQTYQRRERRRRPQPPPPPPSSSAQGFSAADYVPDDMTPADIERIRKGKGPQQ